MANGKFTSQGVNGVHKEVLDEKSATFLKEHDLGVLSTVDAAGMASGAAMYYLCDRHNDIFVLTKSDTHKIHNIFTHHQVALTVFDPTTVQTVQLRGWAAVEPDQNIKERVFNEIVRPRPYSGEVHLPPVTTLHQGGYMVVRITPTDAYFTDYKQRYHEDLRTRS